MTGNFSTPSSTVVNFFNATGSTMTSSTDVTTSPQALDASAVRVLGIVIGIFDIFVGTTGNMLTLIAVLSNKRLQTTFHIFIANLCVIDLLTASTMMPFNVNSYVKQQWAFDDEFSCSFMAFSYYCCGYTSIVCLLTITVNRYIGICHPKHCDVLYTKPRLILVIFISWAFAPAILSPFFMRGANNQRGFAWVQKYTLCVFNITDQFQKNYMEFTRVLFQLVPLPVMVILYTLIFIEVRKSGKDVMARSQRSASRREKVTPPMDSPSFDTTFRDASEWNSTSENQINTSSIVTSQLNRSSVGSSMLSIESSFDKELSSELNQSQQKTSVKNTPKSKRVEELKTKHRSTTVLEPASSVLKIDDALTTNLSSNESPTTGHRTRLKRRYTALQMEAHKRKILDRKLLRMSVAICAVFMILFLPSVLINLAANRSYIDPRVHMLASVITWLNSCVNPAIYCFVNKKMRMQYKIILLKFWKQVCKCIGKETEYSAHTRSIYNKSSHHRSSQNTTFRTEFKVNKSLSN